MKHSKKACRSATITITQSDLPLCCPMPNQEIWDAHPRVYLTLDDDGQTICPYCGTIYQLSDDK